MKIFWGLMFVGFVVYLIKLKDEQDNMENANLYILKTHLGDIWCNYHNSRDTSNGAFQYVDYNTKEYKWISYFLIDSVIVLRENFWSCGPRDRTLKYIDSTKNMR